MSEKCQKQTSAHRRRSAWLTIGAMTWRIETLRQYDAYGVTLSSCLGDANASAALSIDRRTSA